MSEEKERKVEVLVHCDSCIEHNNLLISLANAGYKVWTEVHPDSVPYTNPNKKWVHFEVSERHIRK